MLILAIVPSLILLFAVWKFDTVEKEPIGLLAKLFLGGALTILSAQLIGFLGEKLLRVFCKDVYELEYIFVFAFFLVGLIEEAGKFVVLKLLTWKNKEFNYTFDGVVYAAMVSLGFATIENIVYVIVNGSNASLMRVLLQAPAHLIYGIFMGYFYGLARLNKGLGDEKKVRMRLLEALFVPAVMHGFYVFCLGTEKKVFFILFVIYEIVITAFTVWHFLKLSKEDKLIPGMEFTIDWDDDEQEGTDESKV